MDSARAGSVLRVRVGNADLGERIGPRVVMERHPAGLGSQASYAKPIRFGINQGETKTEVRFRYAYEFSDSLEPVWVDRADARGCPRLVEFEIAVTDRREKGAHPPVLLTGAVALGG
jgi:hypothetical protein